MSYRFLEHASDIGLRACARTKRRLFTEAARGLFDILVDVRTVRARRRVPFASEALQFDLLFVEFLNDVVALGAAKEMVFRSCRVTSLGEGARCRVKGVLVGEPFDPERHEVRTEVKAATYSGLRFERRGGLYCIQCVVDV